MPCAPEHDLMDTWANAQPLGCLLPLHPAQRAAAPQLPCQAKQTSANPAKRGGAYSIPMEMRETATTSKSRILKEFLQKEPLCRKAP